MGGTPSATARFGHVAVALLYNFLLTRVAVVRAQEISGALNSTISFLDSGLTTLGHVTAFLNAVVRGRMDCETVCREALTRAQARMRLGDDMVEMLQDTSRRAKALLTLVAQHKDRETVQFLSHCCSVYAVEPVLLPCRPLYTATAPPNVTLCNCGEDCSCLILEASSESVLTRLIRVYPGAVFKTDDGLRFIPCSCCFIERCHVQHWAGLHLRNGSLEFDVAAQDLTPAMASFTRDENAWSVFLQGKACICMPLLPMESDPWTRVVMRMVQNKDDKDRGAVCEVSDTLNDYLAGTSFSPVTVKEFGFVQSILPRVVEAALTMVLSVWFRVDGFSASLVSRRAVRDFVTDTVGSASHIGFTVKEVVVWKSNSHICQVFNFRDAGISKRHGGPVVLTTASLVLLMGTLTNILSTVVWCVCATSGKWAGQWSSAYAQEPTTIRAWFCFGAVIGCLALDCVHINSIFSFKDLMLYYRDKQRFTDHVKRLVRGEGTLLAIMVAESAFAGLVMVAIVARAQAFRFLYMALELLSWIKWMYGSYKLGSQVSTLSTGTHSVGKWVYASAFLAAGTLAAVGGKWN